MSQGPTEAGEIASSIFDLPTENYLCSKRLSHKVIPLESLGRQEYYEPKLKRRRLSIHEEPIATTPTSTVLIKPTFDHEKISEMFANVLDEKFKQFDDRCNLKMGDRVDDIESELRQFKDEVFVHQENLKNEVKEAQTKADEERVAKLSKIQKLAELHRQNKSHIMSFKT